MCVHLSICVGICIWLDTCPPWPEEGTGAPGLGIGVVSCWVLVLRPDPWTSGNLQSFSFADPSVHPALLECRWLCPAEGDALEAPHFHVLSLALLLFKASMKKAAPSTTRLWDHNIQSCFRPNPIELEAHGLRLPEQWAKRNLSSRTEFSSCLLSQ